ncbi:hypothetical protein GYMLUDRAFT_232775 [Collybiopsis luxurians FD-317 M1]|uniref:DUF6534 domain-containing protein n=1 Tax=Collybiopsis luxurians FD-317 M1 TaxID=944289 RepID=A0A0D0AT03_9AGAR|nr:hypothetical protein GYMLUDRAFT_232775 [Collybiopsis luxurians FD-317 M1]
MSGETSPDIQLLVGPALLGSLFSWCLYGILIIQLYIYCLHFRRDGYKIQITVYGLFVIDTWHTVAITSIAWSFLVSGWGNPDALRFTGWGFAFIPFISGLSAAWVQLFFAWRIFVLGEGRFHLFWKGIVALICAISLTQGIAGMISGIKFLSINDIQQFHLIYGPAATWLAGSAFVDVLIAVSMVVLLSVAKKRINLVNTSTDAVLTRLIHLTIETGSVTAIAAVVDLGFFLGQPKNNLHLLMALILGKLYTNTLYATLISRPVPVQQPPSHSRFEAAAVRISTVTETSDTDAYPNNNRKYHSLQGAPIPLRPFNNEHNGQLVKGPRKSQVSGAESIV